MRIYFELLWIFLRRKLFLFVPNAVRIRMLRQDGVRIGEGCIVHTPYFSTEPYLIEIGNHVAISARTEFITHDATSFVFHEKHPSMSLYGTIRVGNNVFFGINCLVLPNTVIGNNCVIGAGAVVRGVIPDDSVVFGNPAQVIMKLPMLEKLLVHGKGTLTTHGMTSPEKRRALEQHFKLKVVERSL